MPYYESTFRRWPRVLEFHHELIGHSGELTCRQFGGPLLENREKWRTRQRRSGDAARCPMVTKEESPSVPITLHPG